METADPTGEAVSAKLSACFLLAQQLEALLSNYMQTKDLLDRNNLQEYLSDIAAILRQLEEATVLKSAFQGRFNKEMMALLDRNHDNLKGLTEKFTTLVRANRLLR